MTDNRWLEDIMTQSEKALHKLLETELTRYVDTSLPLPQPYLGRAFHPFIHHPSYRSPGAAFCRETWDARDYGREHSNLQAPMIGSQRNRARV